VQLIDRLPFNLESLAASKLGKVIKTLGKGERSPGEFFLIPVITERRNDGVAPLVTQSTGAPDVWLHPFCHALLLGGH